MWIKSFSKKIGAVVASIILSGNLWANNELFEKIDTLIYAANNPNNTEQGKNATSIALQVNSIIEGQYASMLSKNKDVIATLNKEINFYKGNDKLVQYLKKARALEKKNYDKILKQSKLFKATKAIGNVGKVLNAYEILKTAKTAYSNIQEGKANLKNTYLPVAEKIISFNPVAGGLVHIKNEIDNGMNISRGVGENYRDSLYTIRDQYFQQYHILAKKGIEGKPAGKLIELYKQQRSSLRVQLNELYNEANTLVPYIGKSDTLKAINEARNGFMSITNEEKIIEKQLNIYSKMIQHYKNKNEVKKQINYFEKLNVEVVPYFDKKIKKFTKRDEKKDSNKKKLKVLSKKDKTIKAKIKKVKNEEENLKSKQARLKRIRNTKRNAFDKVKSAEKGSDEYNYAKNRFFELSRDYRALNSEINDLIRSINRDRMVVETLQKDRNNIANSLADTVDDYNDDTKIKIAEEEITNSLSGNLWLGSITFNSEDRLAGGATKLRHRGGQFDQTVTEAVQYSGGGPIFNEDRSYMVENGKITSFETGHGQNTATDNTKEFHILNDEIDRTSSFFDQNINSLKLERQLPNGETLSIRTTGHYNYSAWGEWGQTGGLYTNINGGTGIEQKATHNNWQAGQKTQDLPAQGSATYTGVVNGHYYVDSVGSDYGGSVHGTMNMTVDFTNTSVVSGVLNIQKQNGSNFATATMDQMQINRADSGFAGRLVGLHVAVRNGPNDGSQNMIIGQFNGPNAEEVSGIWNLTNDSDELATGVFVGKR